MPNSIVINRALAQKLTPDWPKEILGQGEVLTKRGAYLLDVEGILKAFYEDGEIEFRCHKGNAVDFIEALRRRGNMPCDVRGVPGCQSDGCLIWTGLGI